MGIGNKFGTIVGTFIGGIPGAVIGCVVCWPIYYFWNIHLIKNNFFESHKITIIDKTIMTSTGLAGGAFAKSKYSLKYAPLMFTMLAIVLIVCSFALVNSIIKKYLLYKYKKLN